MLSKFTLLKRFVNIQLVDQTFFEEKNSLYKMRSSFADIIRNVELLNALSSQQAAWIGYYYAKETQDNCSQQELLAFDFSTNMQNAEYNLMMLDRKNNLICKNNNTGRLYLISPTAAFLNKELIEKFSPIQACYIGILAGAGRE